MPKGVRDLLVSEIFGPTFQGEGEHVGRLAAFIRLGGCNLTCRWCDTPYTWAFTNRQAAAHKDGKKYDPQEQMRRVSVGAVAMEVELLMPPSTGGCLVISGGEPMLQQDTVRPMTHELFYECIEIETAGTVVPTGDWSKRVRWNVSPKLEHSGNSLKRRYNSEALTWFTLRANTTFKFVAATEADLEEVATLCKLHDIPGRRIRIMPEGIDVETQLRRMRELADPVLKRGWGMTPRLHTLVWGDERGR